MVGNKYFIHKGGGNYGSVLLPHKKKIISRTYDLVSRTYDLVSRYDLLSRTYDLDSRFTNMPTYTHNISSLILEVETQNWYQIEA